MLQSEIVIQQLELQRPASSGAAPDFNVPVLVSLGLTLMGLVLTGICVWDGSNLRLEVTPAVIISLIYLFVTS